MRKGKTGYKMSARAGSSCKLKPTSASETFQSDCGPFGVNLRTAGNHIFMECKYEYMVCMKPPRICGPALAHWHQQCDTLLGLVLSTSLLAQPSQ